MGRAAGAAAIDKRIPLAGGMAGGSADAAAVLRLAAEAARLDDLRWLEDIAASLGADVPSQIRGGLVLATGIGARLRPLPYRLDYSVVIVPVEAPSCAPATSTPRPTGWVWRATARSRRGR